MIQVTQLRSFRVTHAHTHRPNLERHFVCVLRMKWGKTSNCY